MSEWINSEHLPFMDCSDEVREKLRNVKDIMYLHCSGEWHFCGSDSLRPGNVYDAKVADVVKKVLRKEPWSDDLTMKYRGVSSHGNAFECPVSPVIKCSTNGSKYISAEGHENIGEYGEYCAIDWELSIQKREDCTCRTARQKGAKICSYCKLRTERHEPKICNHEPKICHHDTALFGETCKGCGEIRPLTDSMKAFLKKFPAGSKIKLPLWGNTFVTVTGEFCMFDGGERFMIEEYPTCDMSYPVVNNWAFFEPKKNKQLKPENLAGMWIRYAGQRAFLITEFNSSKVYFGNFEETMYKLRNSAYKLSSDPSAKNWKSVREMEGL